MKVTINDQEFTLRQNSPYSLSDTEVSLYILYDSIDELINIIGSNATIVIADEYMASGLTLKKISKIYDGTVICEVVLQVFPIEATLSRHDGDIEAMAQAIEELAEIIGGDN